MDFGGGQNVVQAPEEDADPIVDAAQACNLLAVSNIFAWAVAAPNEGFSLYALASIRSLVASSEQHSQPELRPVLQVPTPARVDFVRFAMGDKIVLAGMRDGTVGVWRLKSLVEGSVRPVAPITVFPPAPSPLLDLLPNPAPSSSIVAVLSLTGLGLIDLESQSVVSTFPADLEATAACWSVKGKQIAVGTRRGLIAQFTPEGVKKAEIPPPTALEGPWEVRALNWLENTVWLATYARPADPSQPPGQEFEVYIITKGTAGLEYTKFYDPTPSYGLETREGRRWIVRFKGWEPFKHLLFMAAGPSTDVGTLGQTSAWASIGLPDTSRAVLPNTLDGDSTCPLGLELDLSNTDPVFVGAGEDRTEIAPCPNVLVLTSEGVLVVWRLINERGGPYSGMVTSHDVLTNENAAAEAEANPPPPPPQAQPVAAATPPAFAGFGGPVTPSPFGAAPVFGAPAAPAFGASGFGAAPAFGASGFGAPAFGSSAVFGASAFGGAKPAVPASSIAPTAFTAPSSSSGGGFAGFGAVAPASFAAATTSTSSSSPFGTGNGFAKAVPFGTPAAATPFGAPSTPAFGASSTPAFGASSSTSTSTPAFGAPAFGTPSTPAPNAFGASTTSSAGGFGAFGSSSSTSGTSPFNTPGKSIFGANATAPATFGGTSTPTAFGSAPSPSAFGSGGTAFGAGGTAPTSSATKQSATARMGNDSDSDGEDDMNGAGDDDQRRVDEPPDLEPSKSGLDANAAFANAPSSASKLAGGFGGFGLGSSATSTPPAAAAVPVKSIFGNGAATPAFGAKATPSVGFGFGAAAPATSTAGGGAFGGAPKTTSAFGTVASTSAFGSAVSAPSAFGSPSAPSIFGAKPASTPTPNPFLPSSTAPTSAPAANPFLPSSTPTSFAGFGKPATPPAATPITFGSNSVVVLPPAPSPPAPSPPAPSPPPAERVPTPPLPPSTPTPPLPSPPAEVEPPLPPDTPTEPALSISIPSPTEVAEGESSTKSLFGFSSSPPPAGGSASPSLLSRLSPGPPAQEHNDAEEGEEEEGEEEEGSEEEEDEEEEGQHEASEAYDEYTQGDEHDSAEDHDTSGDDDEEEAGHDEAEKEEEVKEEPKAAPKPAPTLFGATAATPSFFSKPPSSTPPASSSGFSFANLAAASSSSPFGTTPAPAPATASPFSFSSAAVEPPKPVVAPTPVPAAKPVVAAPPPPPPAAPKAQPAFAGFGKPSVFGSAGASTAPRNSSPLSGPPTTTGPPPQAANAPSPTPKVQRTGLPMGSTPTPRLGMELATVQTSRVAEQGMTGEFLKMYLELEEMFALLKKNTLVCQAFVKDVAQPIQTPGQQPSYADDAWTMGDLPQLVKLTDKVSPSVGTLVGAALVQKRQAEDLSAALLKAETKREEAARFLRAKTDPAIAKVVRVRQLGPEQIENQKQIRLSVEAVRARVEQVEDHMLVLKDKVMEERLGRSSFKIPSLDAVNRAVRNITVAVSDRMFELDELASRLDLLRVQPDTAPELSVSRSRSRRSPSVDNTLSTSLVGISSPRAKSSVVNPDVNATVQAALNAERSVSVLKRALLAVRSAPLLNKSACASAAPSHAHHPISELHTPTPSFQHGGSAGWSLPAPPASSPFPAFKAPMSISFSTPITATANVSPASSAGSAPRGGGGAQRSSRSHQNAVALRPTADATPPPPSTFDWGDVPKPKEVHVSNFISFGAPSPSFGSPSTPTAARPNGNGKSTTPEGSVGSDESEGEESEGFEGEEEEEEYEGRGREHQWVEDDEALDTISERSEEE
ncbi:hypothetical protein RQP46_001951 [Phenoliferia psychrophenolica]